MAFNDFWNSIRGAASDYALSAAVVPRTQGAVSFDRFLRGDCLWLRPSVVADYEEQDFWFLATSERTKLTQAVQRFRHVASEVSPDQPATKQQAKEAKVAFSAVLELIQPNRFSDPESLKIGKQVEQRLSDDLRDRISRFQCGQNASGQPLGLGKTRTTRR